MHNGLLLDIFPSSSDPENLEKAAFRYNNYFVIKGVGDVCVNGPIELESKQSIVRVYRDIFILFDRKLCKWVFSRIIIP